MTTQTQSVRILHVDDEPGFADLVATYLGREDDRITVETATAASDALDLLAERQFDCVLSDYDMPGRNGIEFLEAIRERHGDLPFILYTGKGSEEIASEAIAAGVTDYIQKDSGSDHYEVLRNRCLNAIEAHSARRRAENLDRIRSVARDVNQALLRAETRKEAEEAVCQVIAEAEPYQFAWIGQEDPETETVVPRASAGADEGYLSSVEITTDDSETARGPTGRAIATGSLQVVQSVRESSTYDPWRGDALDREFRSSAAVPLLHESASFGVLNVYADRTRPFDADERELLEELGSDVAHALHTLQIQADLRETSTRLEALFEHSPDMVDIHGIDGTILDANPRLCDSLGYSKEELCGMDVWEIDETIDPAAATQIWEEMDAGDRCELEGSYRRRDGTTFPVEVHLERLDIEGEGPLFMVISRDVTERKRSEDVLTALHEAGSRITACDTVGAVCEETVRVAASILEFDESMIALEEDGVLEIRATSEHMRDDAVRPIPVDEGVAGKTYRTGEPVLTEDMRDEPDADPQGDFRSGISLPIGDHGNFQAVADEPGAFDETDIELAELLLSQVDSALTRLRHEEQLRERNERLDEFASLVSHDLRNPLTVATGHLELAREDCESEALETVETALSRMDDLIEELLTVARGDVDKLSTRPVSLPSVLEECTEVVDTNDATIESRTERTILADHQQLRQLLENLLANAVEHGSTSPGSQAPQDAVESDNDGVTITVGDLEDGFFVEDDGPGIPPERRDDVFELGNSTDDDGTGIGLHIVAQVAENHGWSVSVTEGSRGGARFEITGVEDA
ncbi:multi-sensor signal transduction histidine kinase [Salinarchaeum sp. Harcht-Bsk1]|uniref:GAF domain-containing protein n=1 Tax=Salinarchaeum sp. Harcht-Bsk1 TaxID=1333523 RepID=UPI00034244DA|nr:GAF domain-containing protein [Salinarchaeum sp. Harcht-Bsk1]AGN00797.1 multi-sensor signal transduction histidine kinase [Salinarchaeum sp. Harcht-Bsk1]